MPAIVSHIFNVGSSESVRSSISEFWKHSNLICIKSTNKQGQRKNRLGIFGGIKEQGVLGRTDLLCFHMSGAWALSVLLCSSLACSCVVVIFSMYAPLTVGSSP
jgi:hypothetical protein